MAHNTTEFPDQPLLSDFCTVLTCPVNRSIFRYQPMKVLALIPLGFFTANLVAHLFLGIRNRTWMFVGAFTAFCLSEHRFLPVDYI